MFAITVMFDQYFRSFRIILCYIIIYAIYIHVTYPILITSDENMLSYHIIHVKVSLVIHIEFIFYLLC